MPTLLLDGTVTAVTPIAIVLPATEDGRTPAGAPRKRLLRDGIVTETVYVPPSSLRGRLRHLLTTEVMRLQHVADGRVFTPDDYIDTALGGVKDRKAADEEGRRVDLKTIRELRQRNPVVSMFGSMVSQVSGRLMVGDMTPEEPLMPSNTGRSVRANPFVRNPAVIELLDRDRFDEFNRLNDLRTQANRDEDEAQRLRRTIAARKRAGAALVEIEEMAARASKLEKAKDDGFRRAGGAVNIQQLLDGYDVIPEGTVMVNRIRLVEGTDVEAALLLLALDLLAKRSLLGGHVAHGCGEITGSWRVRIRDADGLRDGGAIRLDTFTGLGLETAEAAMDKAFNRAITFGKEAIKYDFSAA